MQMKVIREFLRLESTGGIILFIMAVSAIILANSSFSDRYQSVLQYSPEIHLGSLVMHESVLSWINDGLMTLFFLLVGLELKREIVLGELSRVSQVMLPGMAAIGGMIVPAVLYCVINVNNPIALKGWAVPVATDIAFALGVLSLFGKRVPLSLKLFLMALAVFDDIGAILIIAFFYTQKLSYLFLSLAGLLFVCLIILNKANVRRLAPYLVVGCLLWVCCLKSGVHPTVAGVLLAMMIPARKQIGERLSPLSRLEDMLHPWVAFFVMPIFALANAGLSLSGLSLSSFLNPVVFGVIMGLFVGKQLGVFGITWLMIKLGWAKLPGSARWLELYGVALLCGVGFTMSLFLGTLAFLGDHALLDDIRLGVLAASVLSSAVGAFVLRCALKP